MRKKHLLLILGAVIILSGAVLIGNELHERYEMRREEERMAEEQREIEEAYRWIHYAIGRLVHEEDWEFRTEGTLERWGSYQPLNAFGDEPNEFGIFYRIYIILRMYEHRGGVYLSYEKLVDYFSEEFEEDGTLRLYNNGRHPEIEAFVNWMREEPRITVMDGHQVEVYRESLNQIRIEYTLEHQDQGFRGNSLSQLSPQMIDALARAEADPGYVLDLTSLQEAGY